MTGKIRREVATRYDYMIKSAFDEEVQEVSYPYLERDYSEDGNPLREVTFNIDGEIQEHMTYEYDSQGRRITMRNYLDDEEIIETVRYHYDKDDKPVSAIKEYADGSEETINYLYDNDGNLIGKVVLNEDGEIEEQELWRYENGHEVWYERREYDEPVFREEQEYDSEGRAVVITLWEGDTDNTTVHKIFYNDEGQRNRIEKYNEAGRMMSVIEINAFENGEPLEVTETSDGSVNTGRYRYDDKGRMILQQDFNKNNELINEVARTYTEEGLIHTTEVTTDRLGQGMNLHYRIEYMYEYY